MPSQKLAPIEFEFERATKNTFRFQEKNAPEDVVVGTLYIQKAAFGGKEPKAIRVVVEVTE